jgi:ketosteroid isomerase-like protein
MDAALEKHIGALEAALTHATQSIDLDGLSRLYADDILMTSVLGHAGVSKAGLMDEARRGIAQRQAAADAGNAIETSYSKEDLKIVGHGDAAVTSYRFVVKITGGGVDVHRAYRTTNVWMKRRAGWQVVAAHTAFVLDPKQAAMLAGETPAS